MEISDDLPSFAPLETDRTPTRSPDFSIEELQLACRNRGMPLETLRYDITPTGLHYLLSHFDIPAVRPEGFRLEVCGLVGRELTLGLADLMARPSVTRRVTMECAGNGRALMRPRPLSQPWLVEAIGTAEWTGTPLRGLLEEADVQAGAVEAVFTGLDAGMEADAVQRYQRSLQIADALEEGVLLAWAMNGELLPPQHGGPLRLMVPGWYGMASVKWLARIELVERPFEGHYMVGTYRYAVAEGELGEPVTRQRVRALMAPPGMPDFYTRTRLVPAGPVVIEGRAWAGPRKVARVEVSTGAATSWAEARLEPAAAACCWQAWRFDWQARPGRTTLMVRATDGAGERQPLEPVWNRYGMGNNAVQRVEVIVA
jgi:sulfane dehydrogenase subunit SoxC